MVAFLRSTSNPCAQVWAEWAEMLIKHNQAQKALELMRRATKVPPGRQAKTVRLLLRSNNDVLLCNLPL